MAQKSDNMTALEKIVLFNNLAGNECYKRPLEDDLVLTYLSLIKEEKTELFKAWAEGDIEETLDGAADLIVVAAGLLHALGYNPSEVLDEVCEANLSKFCTTEDDAKSSVKAYENDGRYYDVHYTKVGDRYVIRGRKVDAQKSDYKILKGVNTRKPNFKKIIQEGI